ncbi:hypothetical protein [Methylocystis heyeri]|uniref:Uncharacterized protein n=1 Tax=Methylocystis heyeri TaxID=391905 RepID=A0A6B8KHB1_9HYPH|nr:hypothetical protein [Methylocystis heyeri]QGM47012.1 hypothetical protein H2LOC_015685 [Methylocystis heyeri]
MKEPHEFFEPKLIIAWNEYHRTPKDFSRVEPFFVEALSDGTLQARHHYAKFIEQFDKPRAKTMFLELSGVHETSKLFYARHLAFFGSRHEKLRAIAILKKMATKGNSVARFFLEASINKLMIADRRFLSVPCSLTKQILICCSLARDADRARKEMWGA